MFCPSLPKEALINSTRRSTNVETLTFASLCLHSFGFPLQPKQMEPPLRSPLLQRPEKPTPIRTQAPLTNRIFTSLVRRLVGSWRSIHTAEKEPPLVPSPSAVCSDALNHFYPLPDFQTPSWRALMAAQGKGSNRGRAKKYTTRESRELWAVLQSEEGSGFTTWICQPRWLADFCVSLDTGQSDSTSLVPTVKRLHASKAGSNNTVITPAIPFRHYFLSVDGLSLLQFKKRVCF